MNLFERYQQMMGVPSADPNQARQAMFGAIPPPFDHRMKLSNEMTHQGFQGPSMHPLDTLAMSTMTMPVVGDVTGLMADARMYAQEPESRTPLNFGLSALGLLPFVPGMTVFHGSPHKFDKFQMDKIGTGEGAQAYGHGLYVAESPDVAKSYTRTRRILEGIDNDGYGLGRDEAERIANNWLDYQKVNPDELHYFAKGDDASSKIVQGIIDGKVKESRHLYEVDLPDEHIEKMLDWDAPLSEQPEAVREALRETGLLEEMDGYLDTMRAQSGEAADLAERMILGDQALRTSTDEATKNWGRLSELIPESTGIELNDIHDLAEAYDYPLSSGEGIYGLLANGDQAAASARLNELGIPGIKYLDGGSRTAGEGTRNFVVFDDSLLKIKSRNGGLLD